MAEPAEMNFSTSRAVSSLATSCISGTLGSSGVRLSPPCRIGVKVPFSILSLSSARHAFQAFDTMSTSPRSSASV